MRALSLIVVAALVGCGGAQKYRSAPPSHQPARGPGGEPAPSMAAEADHRGYAYDFSDDVVDGSLARPPSSRPPPPPKPRTEPREPKTEALAKPLVVYLGYLKLRVKRLLEAVDAITAKVEALQGYIESLTQTVVVVRVPAGDFEAAMAAFAELGTVLARRVKALDVTEKFTDLRGRLVVARDTRDRLLALLEEVTDTKERLRILQEVKRLTEQIESIEARLRTLKNLVDYYTITLELESVVASTRAVVHRSPFPWVRGLQAHLQTLGAGAGAVRLPVPDGFVFFDQADAWRAQAADTTVLRAGRVDNEPRGTSAWWSDAVRHEMVGRDEEEVEEGTAGGMAWRVFRNKDVQPRSWLVGVQAQGAHVFVVEAFFPNQAAFDRHRDAVVEGLQSFRVKD